MAELKVRTYIQGEVIETDFLDAFDTKPITENVVREIESALARARRASGQGALHLPTIDNRRLLPVMRTGVIKSEGYTSIGILESHIAYAPTINIGMGTNEQIKVRIPSVLILRARRESISMALFSQSTKTILSENPFSNVFSNYTTLERYEYAGSGDERSRVYHLCLGHQLEERVRNMRPDTKYDVVDLAAEIMTTNPNSDLDIVSRAHLGILSAAIIGKFLRGEISEPRLDEIINNVAALEERIMLSHTYDISRIARDYHINLIAMHVVGEYMDAEEGAELLERLFSRNIEYSSYTSVASALRNKKREVI